MSSDRHKTLLVVCFAAAAYRIFWAFAITTLFVPDEYYQTVEPSKMIFDGTFESGLNSTWEWRDEYRIRSFVPLLPYLLLHHLKFFGKIFPTFFSSEILALKGPRLMNSLISSCSDFAFFFILEKFTKSSGIAFFVLCVHLFSWSASYCLSRTLANSTETALIIIGLFFWLSEHHSGFGLLDYPLISSVQSSKKLPASMDNSQCKVAASETRTLRGVEGLRSRKPATETSKETDSAILPEPSKKAKFPLSLAVALITITVHCRPTAVLFWAPLIGLRILQKRNPLKYIAFHCIPTGLITFLSCIAIDSFFYKDLTVTPFNFFYINVSRNYAELYYGAKPWHWNFSNGFPVMLGLYTPTLIYSCIYTMQPVDAIVLELTSVLYAVLLRCVTAHQEFRFLLPCVAFLHIAVGFTLWNATVWCIPRLGKPYKGTTTLLSYCLSGLSTNILTNVPLLRHGADTADADADAVNPGAEDVLLNDDQSPINCASSISPKKKKKEKKKEKESNRIPEDCHDGNIERESGSAGSRVHVGMRAVGILALSSVLIAHIGAAYYLSTRHQRGAETSLVYLSKYINAQHLSKSSSTSTSSTPPCEVVVLLLAPCHSFPGFGLLAELIEHTGCTVELFSPDCSPAATSTLSNSGSNGREQSSASTAVAPALSESKRFEADPALFIDPSGSFSSVWEGADYVLTFNSYMDNMWPTLHSQGFRLVLD